MKKRMRDGLAALVCVGLFLVFSPSLFKDSGIPWFSWDRITGPRHFYFARKQWLADMRTVAAAVRFLYETSTGSSPQQELPEIPPPQPLPPSNTNFIGMVDRAWAATDQDSPRNTCQRLTQIKRDESVILLWTRNPLTRFYNLC